MRSEALTGGLARPCSFLSALVRILSFQLTGGPCGTCPWRRRKDREKRPQAQRQPPARPAPAVGRWLGGGERRPGPFGLFNAAPVAAGDRSRRKNACCVQISRAGHAALHAALSVRRVFGRLPRLHRPARSAKTAAPPPAPRFAPAALCPGRCFALAAALPWPVLCPGRCCLGWHTVRRRFSIPLRVCPACSSERGGSVPRAAAFGAG